MRITCIECVAKHVGSALVLLSESLHGYQDHLILAIGELEQAVQECETEYPQISETIRHVRKMITSEVPEVLLEEDAKKRTEHLSDIAEKLSKFRSSIMEMLILAAHDGLSTSPTDGV